MNGSIGFHLDNALAALTEADDHLRCIATNCANRARTDFEQGLANEAMEGRKALARLKEHLASIHPNGDCHD